MMKKLIALALNVFVIALISSCSPEPKAAEPIEPIKFSDYNASLISSYISNKISDKIVRTFNGLYDSWKERCSQPDIAIHSNPVFYKQCTEYESLLEYCSSMRSKVMPLVYEKVCEGEFLSVTLMEDLMSEEDKVLLSAIKSSLSESELKMGLPYIAKCFAVTAFERDYRKK